MRAFDAMLHIFHAHTDFCFSEDLDTFFEIDGKPALYSKEELRKFIAGSL